MSKKLLSRCLKLTGRLMICTAKTFMKVGWLKDKKREKLKLQRLINQKYKKEYRKFKNT